MSRVGEMTRIKIISSGVTAKGSALTQSQLIKRVKDIILAGLRVVCRLGGGGNRRRRVKIKVMEWWHKIVFPVRRAWFAISARVKARKNGAGLLKLHDDIQTCGYEDVQIMWEMLKKTESEVMSNHNKRKQRWFSRNFSCSNHGLSARSFSTA